VKYKAGYKYQLVEDEWFFTRIFGHTIKTDYIELHSMGTLIIRKGYAWDGATGAVDTNTILRGSVGHDALYQLIRMGLLSRGHKKEADDLLELCCIEDGMWGPRVKLVRAGVDKMGFIGLRDERMILEAP